MATGEAERGAAGAPGAEVPQPGSVVQVMFGAMAARTVYTAVELGIADLIGEGESTPEAVAEGCTAEPRSVHRLLRALTALGLLQERRQGVFALTATGALLGTSRPDSLAAFVRMFADPVMLRAWDHLGDSVRSGEPSFDAVFGTDFFSHLKQHPALSAQFNASMSQGSRLAAAVLPGAYDFGRFRTVVDVGGGDGTLLAAILREHPGLRGVVYDTEEGLAQAAETFARAGVADRASCVAGDFFSFAPEGGDLYLLKSVVHDWNDEQCTRILGHCRAVLPPEGRLLLVEPTLPAVVPPDAPPLMYLSDLNMLVNLGGRERTEEDFTALCRAAGFQAPVFRQLPPPQAFRLIEAAPAD
ncbi:putative O-methyltransferase [Streptomyces albus]|uniref:Putative O-methyltransferase n=1 Tax=Streptomyces albus (strain ATCC 21838 / DSM 41398 / FERM P-419 / JCM 4703 / NBRC 107858) TaxID=1081613 RepID=A0A0B5EVI1_STRA4|nr:putative O-methyltransferase [Streptomyces albus]AOU80103.1 putative O-methyltransferase [Streptomyces albus]